MLLRSSASLSATAPAGPMLALHRLSDGGASTQGNVTRTMRRDEKRSGLPQCVIYSCRNICSHGCVLRSNRSRYGFTGQRRGAEYGQTDVQMRDTVFGS